MQMSATASKIVNLSLYQLGWFSCVLGAAWGYPLAGGGLALLLVLTHLWLTEDRYGEVRLMLLAVVLGALVDSGQQALGLFRFKADAAGLFLPFWVLVIWAQFASLFRFALSWLSGRPLLAGLLGFFGGPLAYFAGMRLGAAEFSSTQLITLGVLAVIWGLVVPFLSWSSVRIGPTQGHYRARLGEDK